MAVGSWILAIFYGIFRIVLIALTFLWRIVVAFAVTARGFLLALWNNRIIGAILLGLFAVGLPMQLFQEEIMTEIDREYECGAYPAVEFLANAFPLPIIRVPWDVVAPEYNDIALLLVDGIDSLFSDMRTLVRIRKLTSVKSGLSTIMLMLFDDELSGFSDVFNDIAEGVLGYFEGWWDFLKDIGQWITQLFLSWAIRFDAFGGSCSLCSADPNPDCNLRKKAVPFIDDYNCDTCHELQADMVGLIGSLLDALTGNFVTHLSGGTSFRRIFRGAGCIMRSIWMYPLQMVDASVALSPGPPPQCMAPEKIFNIADDESLITRWFIGGDKNIYDCSINGSDGQLCCGKPSGCEYPSQGGEDLPVGIAPCIGELFLALTDDEIEDWIEVVLSFLLEIVATIIKTVERSIECMNPPPHPDTNNIAITECFNNFQTQSGTAGTDPGICWYDDSDAVPDGGIHDCMGMILTCLADDVENKAPLLAPLIDVGIIKFFLEDLWRFSVDFVFCPFSTLADCMNCPGCAFGEFVDKLENLGPNNEPDPDASCSPAWWSVLEWLWEVLNWINTNIVSPIADFASKIAQFATLQAAFNNMAACWEGCEVTDFTTEIGEMSFLECFPGGDGTCEDEMPSFTRFMDRRRRKAASATASDELTEAAALQHWQQSITRWGIHPSSFCGGVLHSHTLKTILDEKWGEYVTFMGCYGMYQMRRGVEDACAVNHSTSDGLSSVVHDITATLHDCDREGLALINNKRPRNSTEPLPPLPTELPLNFTRSGIPLLSKLNFSHVNLVPEFLQTVYDQVKTTRIYGRTVEFYDTYRVRLGTGIDLPKDVQTELDDIYTDYANDIISFYHRRKFRNETDISEDELSEGKFFSTTTRKVRSYMTATSMRSTRAHLINKMEQLHILESEGGENVQLHAKIDAETMQRWKVINDALHLEYRPWFQSMAGVVRALRTRDGSNLAGMLSGSTKYVTSRSEFVPSARFRREAFAAGNQVQPSLLDAVPQSKALQLALGDEKVQVVAAINKARGGPAWQARKARAYLPFPVPRAAEGESDWVAPDTGPSWREVSYPHMSRTHAKYMKRRADHAVEIEKRGGKAIGDFDANQILYDALDFFFGIFAIGGTDGLVNGLVANTIEFWDAFDLRNFTEESVQQTITDFFSCSIPENIDGSSMHSPWCFGLFREDAYALFSAVSDTEGQFPPQIPWPNALITSNCTTVYNGEGALDIFAFAFSNNCDLDPATVTTSNCTASGSCAGDIALQAAEVVAKRNVVEYQLDQSNAMCAIESITLPIPDCATVKSIVSNPEGCVASFNVSLDAHSGCEPGVPLGLFNEDIMHVSLALDVNHRCSFNVTFSKGVLFAAGESLVAIAAEGESTCKNCTLRVPQSVCLTGGSALHDPWAELRPFCDLSPPQQCDYCEREYQSCADAGFGDFLDELFYLTGIIPRVGDDILFSGFDAKEFEIWYGPVAAFGGFLIALPFFPMCCLGFPVWAVAINLAHLSTWTLFILFGDVLPYPLVFFSIMVYVQTRVQGTGQFLRPVIAIIYLTFTLWILSLIFTFPLLSDVFNINQALSDILLALDDSVWLFFLDTRPLIARVDNYIYPTGTEVPELHTFCFWWNWANLALVSLLFMFAVWPILLLFRWIFAPILLTFETIWFALDMRRRIIYIRTREIVASTKGMAKNNKSRFRALRDATKRRIGDLKDKFVRKLITGNGGSDASLPLAANDSGPRHVMLNFTPDPDETHAQFRERRSDSMMLEMAADHVSDDDDDENNVEAEDEVGAGMADLDDSTTTTAITNESGPDAESVEASVVAPQRRPRVRTLRLRGKNPDELTKDDG